MSEQRNQRPTGQVGAQPHHQLPPRDEQKQVVSDPVSGTETVTVACKVANGIVLHIDDMVERTEAAPSGSRTFKIAQARPQTYTLKGPAVDIRQLQAGNGIDKLIVGGYALTPGIPKDFWDAWYEQNSREPFVHPLIANHQVFAMPNESRARSRATELAAVRSGLEPIDRNNPSERMPRSRMKVTPATSGADA